MESRSVTTYEEQYDEFDDTLISLSLNTLHDNSVRIDNLIQNAIREIQELEKILQIQKEQVASLQSIVNTPEGTQKNPDNNNDPPSTENSKRSPANKKNSGDERTTSLIEGSS